MAGSEWKLVQEGQSAEGSQEPQFSTWEDVVNKKKARGSNEASSQSESAGSAQGSAANSGSYSRSTSRRVLDDAFYRYAADVPVMFTRTMQARLCHATMTVGHTEMIDSVCV